MVVNLLGVVAYGWYYLSIDETNVGKLTFHHQLRIPPLAEPTIDEQGGKHFDLTVRPGTTELLDGVQTPTWGVNGSYLGPTLRASRGDEVSINVTNDLPETTTMHWHGMRLPARMDGGPHQPIEPGAVWSPHWTIDQPAASLWYHPHLDGTTAKHVYQGVAGMFLIDDAESAQLALPSAYGVDDIPLIVQDKRFADDGTLDMSPRELIGFNYGLMGDEILVNGTHDPYLKVSTQRVRLRVLNAANSRSFAVAFADGRSFQQIATDSGLLAQPRTLQQVRLSPGERAEIVAEFQPGEQVILRSVAPGRAGGFPLERIAGAADEFDLLKIIASDQLAPSPPVPATLATTPEITAPADARVRTFTMSGYGSINSRPMDMGRIDEVVPAGATEIWELDNPGLPHSFHIHDVAFRVLDVNGEPPPPWEQGRKDTVYLPPGTKVRLLVQFGRDTDPDHPYMYHCHMLEHEDAGMMGQFVIVEPGTEDTVPRTITASHPTHGG